MKRFSTNQEEEIIKFILDKFKENNPSLLKEWIDKDSAWDIINNAIQEIMDEFLIFE